MTLAEVRSLDNAHWWAPGQVVAPDAGEWPLRGRAPGDPALRIALLDEVLEEFPGVVLNLDIKQTAPEVEPYEALLADALRNHGRTDDVIVASFIDRATDAFSALAPEVPTSLGTNGTAAFYFAVRAGEAPPSTRHVALQVPPDFQDTPIVTGPMVEAAHDAGLAVHVWTIDEAIEMERLIDLGVDGIITDRPSVCTEVLERRALSYRP
jgi:glycerophosphoryl diester phosphodiesterase